MMTAAQALHPQAASKGEDSGTPGFSVLEAIIAIAILAIAFLPLLGLQTQMTRTTLALERNTQLMEAKRSALAYMQTLNPMRNPQGELDLGNAKMHWKAVQISQERPAMKMGGTQGRFMVALYDVEVTLTFDTQRTQNFFVHATGWRSRQDFLSDL